jgi:Ca-activated chloride channel family protein
MMRKTEVDVYDIPIDQPIVDPDDGDPNLNTEEYDKIVENEFLDAQSNPLSTFSIDVDNASYSNVRRFLNYNELPDKGAVRIEEMINYFTYDYPDPKGEHPFSFNTEIADCPWNKENKLIHIGIQGKN